MAKKKTDKRFAMSDEHKAALATGRTEGRAVRSYLAALEQEKKPGRKVDRATLESRVAELRGDIDVEPEPAKRLELIQRRIDAEAQLAKSSDGTGVEALEEDFVAAAAGYSERKGITYTAWRELGVPAAVLKRAGVARTRRTN